MRGEDSWTKVLKSKAKLVQKRYKIVALGIPIAKIDLEKAEETKEKIVMQNISMCANMKIESIFWLSILKKYRRTSLLVVEVDDAKIANILIEEGLVLDHTLHRCIRYNLACKIKQCFNCYEYDHVLVYYQKSIKCGAYLDSHRTSEYPQNKAQKFLLCSGAHPL